MAQHEFESPNDQGKESEDPLLEQYPEMPQYPGYPQMPGGPQMPQYPGYPQMPGGAQMPQYPGYPMQYPGRPGRTTRVRVVHAIPGGPAVDVYIDGRPVLRRFSFGSATPYLNLPAGGFRVDVYAAGTRNRLLTRRLGLRAGVAYTLALVDQARGPRVTPGLSIFEDDPRPASGRAKVRFIHLSPTAPALDVDLGRRTLFNSVRYLETTDYRTLNPQTVNLVVRISRSNQVVLRVPSLHLRANQVYSILAIGNVDGRPPLRALILKGG